MGKILLKEATETNFKGIYKIPKSSTSAKAQKTAIQSSTNLTKTMDIPKFTQQNLANRIQVFLKAFEIYNRKGDINHKFTTPYNKTKSDDDFKEIISQLTKGFKGYEIKDYEEVLEGIFQYLTDIKELKKQEITFKSLLKQTNNNQEKKEINKIIKEIEQAKGGLMNEGKKTELEENIKKLEKQIKDQIKKFYSYEKEKLKFQKQKLEKKLETIKNQPKTTRLDIYETVLQNLQIIIQNILEEKKSKTNKNREKALKKIQKRRYAVNDNLLKALNLK